VVVEESAAREALKGAVKPWVADAPAVIVVCGDHDEAWRRRDGKDHTDIDCAIAVDHMTLMATAQGLGTCWVCSFDAWELARILQLPPHLEAIAVLPIGVPVAGGELSPDRHEGKRKALSAIVSRERFEGTE
jgi:nitroreductase